ncbi:MAG: sigma-70 family RNA polymerase sigma factor [Chloroflexota bacterium]|nr:sigma-70 family RNA polymerase sigma factor [Chloroflexota bacterium]
MSSLEQSCAEAVDRLLSRHGWQLLGRAEFVRRTVAAVQGRLATDPQRAATHIYSLALYHACSGAEGEAQQERGYTELFQYLYDSAYWQYRDVCDDATQLAIERVYANFERCRVPAAFLAWAFQQLRDAARTIRRKRGKRTTSLDEPVGPGLDALGALLADPRQVDPTNRLELQEQQTHLKHLVAAFLQQHPRADQQLAALLLKHVQGLDDEAIAEQLDKPVRSVHVLRARARKKLEQEPAWRAFARDLGIALEIDE